ncbi:Molybdate-binding periplasmic protein [Fundidesulfovibrio magnetotacticus]|uniref:Molybdate-binding periplasmic protein n=1 Tax=Fundidesulfovibrio magnetotacticus TaxID=2730080 RepID=A0A6V8LWQ2_9BACT|nr:extracellular solute-binding protein [Fundidesulfovibrio magnetotacticus]GFK94698.1 Molybdate-binding periplasmic protein [Fundidesulfovibrio magnetotacticus]
MKKSLFLVAACLALLAGPALAQTPASQPPGDQGLSVFHAGSLAKPMADLAKAFTAETGVPVTLTGSGSGSLRQRIEAGERPGVFASADMGNPEALAAKGLASRPAPFARNVVCALAKKSVGLTRDNLLDKLMDPAVKVGTSTPVLDPGGDYAWIVFDKAEALKKGAAQALKAKAIKLVGDPALPMPPKDYPRGQIAWHLEEGRADVFLVYLTTSRLALAELPGLEIVELPESLAVGALYGVSLVEGHTPRAKAFTDYLLGPKGQAVLEGYGFRRP